MRNAARVILSQVELSAARVSVLLGTLFLGSFTMVVDVAAQNQTLIFSATGDIPYSSSEVPILQEQIRDHNTYSPAEFW